MRTRWFDRDLDSVATLWRLERRDGVTLGFAAHDRTIRAEGLDYLAAPGIQLSAIEADDGLEALEMDVRGALAHDAIRSADCDAGRWDGARISIGLVDWTEPDGGIHWLFRGELGAIARADAAFRVELLDGKARLQEGFVPYATPICRAEFCGPGCSLSRALFEGETVVAAVEGERVRLEGIDPAAAADLVHGELVWMDGANAGLRRQLWSSEGDLLALASPLPEPVTVGDRARTIQGCDKSFETCAARFGNGVNFQGEPHLPGNDLLTRYGR